MTVPTRSSATMTSTSSTGSSRHVPARVAASRSASPPAVWNAMSEESTLWDLPSVRVTLRSTTGQPFTTP